jgi:hypothetical protein
VVHEVARGEPLSLMRIAQGVQVALNERPPCKTKTPGEALKRNGFSFTAQPALAQDVRDQAGFHELPRVQRSCTPRLPHLAEPSHQAHVSRSPCSTLRSHMACCGLARRRSCIASRHATTIRSRSVASVSGPAEHCAPRAGARRARHRRAAPLHPCVRLVALRRKSRCSIGPQAPFRAGAAVSCCARIVQRRCAVSSGTTKPALKHRGDAILRASRHYAGVRRSQLPAQGSRRNPCMENKRGVNIDPVQLHGAGEFTGARVGAFKLPFRSAPTGSSAPWPPDRVMMMQTCPPGPSSLTF